MPRTKKITTIAQDAPKKGASATELKKFMEKKRDLTKVRVVVSRIAILECNPSKGHYYYNEQLTKAENLAELKKVIESYHGYYLEDVEERDVVEVFLGDEDITKFIKPKPKNN